MFLSRCRNKEGLLTNVDEAGARVHRVQIAAGILVRLLVKGDHILEAKSHRSDCTPLMGKKMRHGCE